MNYTELLDKMEIGIYVIYSIGFAIYNNTFVYNITVTRVETQLENHIKDQLP